MSLGQDLLVFPQLDPPFPRVSKIQETYTEILEEIEEIEETMFTTTRANHAFHKDCAKCVTRAKRQEASRSLPDASSKEDDPEDSHSKDSVDYVVYTTPHGMVCVHYGEERRTIDHIQLVSVFHGGKHIMHTDTSKGDPCVRHCNTSIKKDVTTLLEIVDDEHYMSVVRYLASKGMRLK